MAEHLQKLFSSADRIESGYNLPEVPPTGSLVVTIQEGIAFIGGRQVGRTGDGNTSLTLTPSATNYVYVRNNSGTGAVEFNTTGVLPANSLLLWTVTTSATQVTAKTDNRDYTIDLGAPLRVSSLALDGATPTITGGSSISLVANQPYVRLEDTNAGGIIARIYSRDGFFKITNDAASVEALKLNITKTVVFVDSFATSGAFSITLTSTGVTNVTLPTTGTLATLAGTETFTNKTLTSPIIANIAPGANFTLTQNAVAVITSVNMGAVANTLYVSAGNVGIGGTPQSNQRLQVAGIISATSWNKSEAIAIVPTLEGEANNSSMFGLSITPTFAKAAWTSLDARGLVIDGAAWNVTGTGTIANAYGLHITAPTIGTNNYALYVASGTSYLNGNVGIGTNAPNFGGWNNALTGHHATGSFGFEVSSSRTDADGALIGGFRGHFQTNSVSHKEIAGIDFLTDGATINQRGGAIVFKTKANGSTTFSTKMWLLGAGNLGLGVSPIARLHVKASSAAFGGGLRVERSATSDYWEWVPEASTITLGYNGASVLLVTTGGDLQWKSGTSFNGTIAHAITADRTYTFPDKSGTVAMLDDATGVFIMGRTSQPAVGVAQGGTTYMSLMPVSGGMFDASESNVEARVPSDITVTRLTINTVLNNVDNSSTVVLRKNGVDTAITISIPAGVPGEGNFTATGSVSFARGDRISVKMTVGAGVGGDVVSVSDIGVRATAT